MSNATDNPKIEVLKAGGSGVFTNYIYKAIPLAFDESMSYYETLAGLRDYLEETVIPTVNNNAEAVAELQGLYEELNAYVDNYFDNLDVQEEINNKLDELVADGTLERLIGTYIDPLIENQNQEISNFKTQVNGQIAQQNAKIQAVESGSPLVASSTAGMTDTTRVYVNTTDGKWYYYNGTQWVAGGVYQSTGLDLDTTLTNPNKAPNSKSVGDYVFQNRANIGSNEERLTNYDGIIKPVDLQIARISYSQNGFSWYHDNLAKNSVSTMDNTEYHLQPNDIVSLKDYTTYRFKIIYRDMAGTYHYSDWRTSDYIIPVEGYYIFSIQRIDETVLDNAVEITKQFSIKTNNYEENTFRSKSLSANDYVKSKLVNGNMNTNNGAYQAATNRATFYDFIKINKNICVDNINRDFTETAYLLDENNAITTLSGNVQKIPANTRFKIVIKRKTETSEEIVSVEELASSIQVYEETNENVDNIFDERHLEPGYLDNSGNIVDTSNTSQFPVTSTKYYEIKEGEHLLSLQIINPSQDMDWYAVAFYDENETFLGRLSLYPLEKNIKHLISLVPTAKYFRISYRHYLYAKIMVNYGYNFPEYKHYPIEETGRKMYNLSNYGIFGIAHAGGGVAPENTIPAYKLAKQRGFNFAECDIQFTSDNVPILMHDATVDRTTDGTGRIRQMTLEQIEALNIPGSGAYTNLKVPTFEELIVLCKKIKLIPIIELKMDDITIAENHTTLEILYNIIKKYDMEDRVIFLSVSYTKLLTMRDIDPYATLCHLSFQKKEQLNCIYRLDGILRTPTNQVRCSMNRVYLDDDTFLNTCKELNLPLDIWTFYGENGMLNVNQYISGVTSESNNPYEKVIYDGNINV